MVVKSLRLFFVILALLLFSSTPGYAQVPGLATLGDLGSLNLGAITITPSAKIGYKVHSLRLSFPLSSNDFLTSPPNWYHFVPTDFTINRSDLVVGSLGLKADHSSGVILYGAGTASASRSVTVTMPKSPWTARGAGDIDWDGSNLEWWQLDFGGGYALRDNISLLAGLRIDHYSVGLDDPQDPTGTISLSPGDILIGDIRTKMWAPYVGLGLKGDKYQARIIYSPITSADVKVPLQYASLVAAPPFAQDASYTQFKTGWYAGFDLSHRVFTANGLDIKLWASGAWSKIRGTGTEIYTFPCLSILALPTAYAGEATSTFATWSISGGVSAGVEFETFTPPIFK